jgi:Flp pilus assembly protein TadD
MMRFGRRRLAFGWPRVRPSRATAALGLASLLIPLALIPVTIAQSSRRPAPGMEAATRALIEGRYDEVAELTGSLDQQDPGVVALNARALIARGRYQDAEAMLRRAAERAPSSDAALELGLLLRMLGRADATAALVRVASLAASASQAADLARAARALAALDRVEDAHATFRDAAALAPRDAAINTAWGELLLDKQQKAEAVKSFQIALEVDARYVPAMLGIARALADDNPPAAIATAKKILEVNPSEVGAHIFLAVHAADAGRRDEARELLRKALAINPSSLEAIGFLAALEYVEDNPAEFDAQVARALAIAPTHSDVYRVAGDLAARNYRFDEAAALVRRALALDPRNQKALADLGIHLLRTGDEPGARQALEASFKLDPYDVVTFNLLQMMDTLDTFVTVTDGDIVLRLHKDEAPVLQDYALSLARRALGTLSKRYEFTPKGPILIEMFPKHDDFAVRNVGLPGMIGALGACFGRVVTLDSPRARPGEFQWEATLWHELAHVVTLQMSNQRVPRWLTEGISVYEEALERREWGRGMDVSFAALMNRGETIKLRDLNAAFQNPQTISLAYYQASLLVEHLVERFGDQGLHRLVRAHGQGLDTEAALAAALSTDFDQLQTGFDQALERRFGALRKALEPLSEEADLLRMPVEALTALAEKNPTSYQVQLALGNALRQGGNSVAAVPVFERAAALVPMATGEDSPNVQIAQIAIERGDSARAMSALEAVLAADFDNIGAARELARLMKESGVADPVRLRLVYERIAAIDPFDAEAHATLGRLAMQRDDAETAIREFRAVVALGPVDQASAHTDLAESYFRSGQRAEARKQTLAALEIAPSYQRAQELLLKLAEGRP